jgi:hypothetical protein
MNYDGRMEIAAHTAHICLTFNGPAAFSSSDRLGECTIVSDSEDPESAADRLEAALERIAEAAIRAEARPGDQLPKYDAEEVAARLDAVINRLRAALGRTD